MEKILVSACLTGAPVRYDGADRLVRHRLIEQWRGEGRLVAICPEIAGGLPVPRPPAEIVDGRVVDTTGRDVSAEFAAGAAAALDLARAHHCRFALLKENSPSCGVNFIHDGAFAGVTINGVGVAARALADADVRVFSEHEIDALAAALAAAEAGSPVG
ncbi:MAG: DUF523 domain-containing protein [Parvularculaceae bacterium]